MLQTCYNLVTFVTEKPQKVLQMLQMLHPLVTATNQYRKRFAGNVTNVTSDKTFLELKSFKDFLRKYSPFEVYNRLHRGVRARACVRAYIYMHQKQFIKIKI